MFSCSSIQIYKLLRDIHLSTWVQCLWWTHSQLLKQCLGNLINVLFENIVVTLPSGKTLKTLGKKGKDLLLIGNHIKLARFQSFSKTHTHAILKNLNTTRKVYVHSYFHYSSTPSSLLGSNCLQGSPRMYVGPTFLDPMATIRS